MPSCIFRSARGFLRPLCAIRTHLLVTGSLQGAFFTCLSCAGDSRNSPKAGVAVLRQSAPTAYHPQYPRVDLNMHEGFIISSVLKKIYDFREWRLDTSEKSAPVSVPRLDTCPFDMRRDFLYRVPVCQKNPVKRLEDIKERGVVR